MSVATPEFSDITLPEAELYPVIDSVGNHPAKMLTLGVLSEQPHVFYSSSNIGTRLRKLQGDNPGWLQQSNNFKKYCEKSLGPIGMLVESKIDGQRGHPVDGYRISQKGLEIGIPAAGALLEWELENPNLSLQKLLGSSNTPGEVEARMPTARSRVYEELITHPNNEASFSDIMTNTRETFSRVETIINELRHAGVISVETKTEPGERTLLLSEPDMEYIFPQIDNVLPETLALYGTAGYLVAKRVSRITGDAFLEEMSSNFPDLDPTVVWKRLIFARAAGRVACIELEPFSEDVRKKLKINLVEEYDEPVQDYLNRLSKLRHSPSYIEQSRNKVAEIMSEPALVASLMKKAQENSHCANALSIDTWRQILATKLLDGPQDTFSLHSSVSEDGYNISYTAFRQLIRELNEDGSFDIIVKSRQGRARMPLTVISLPE